MTDGMGRQCSQRDPGALGSLRSPSYWPARRPSVPTARPRRAASTRCAAGNRGAYGVARSSYGAASSHTSVAEAALTNTCRRGMNAPMPATSASGEGSRGSLAADEPVFDESTAEGLAADVLGEEPSGSERLEAFSDGIMAIAITLLILDVRLPSGQSNQSLLVQLGSLWPSYLAYLDSFLTLGVVWVCHHAFFRRIRHVDVWLMWANLVLMAVVAFYPFPTAVLSAHIRDGGASAKVATAFFALIATVQACAWLLMWAAVRHRPGLLKQCYDASYARVETRLGWIGVAVFSACTALALVAPWLALGVYLLTVLGFGATSNGWHTVVRRQRPHA